MTSIIVTVINDPGARFTKQTYNHFYPKFLVEQSYNVF